MVNCGKSFYTKRQCNLKYPNLFHCDKKWQMQCLFDFGAYLQVTHFSFFGVYNYDYNTISFSTLFPHSVPRIIYV